MTEEKPLPMVRINTRIRHDQQKFIKARAKTRKLTEGEVFRAILDKEMKTKK
ncbi:MAG: hypothetical protein KAS32_12515 [Candidatus Peribacteraceae bacterium]|nr:hypothetical protein [Candidatus Peribacteraceae bacterium]